MDLLAAIKREERKLENELGKFAAQIERRPCRSKSTRQQGESGSHSGQEASNVPLRPERRLERQRRLDGQKFRAEKNKKAKT